MKNKEIQKQRCSRIQVWLNAMRTCQSCEEEPTLLRPAEVTQAKKTSWLNNQIMFSGEDSKRKIANGTFQRISPPSKAWTKMCSLMVCAVMMRCRKTAPKTPPNKMQPTNPNAHTYVNGDDVETHGNAAVQNISIAKCKVSSVECGVGSVECGV